MRRRLSPPFRSRPGAAALACGLTLLAPGTALAVVSDVQPIDGPSADVIDVADAAMAEDGSGGIVYLKQVGGRDHVFVARFGRLPGRPPQRVDVGQDFDSSWARIGAGDGGRLVVTWVQEFGTESDRMFSATLDPGASRLPAPRADRLQRRRGNLDLSRPGDEPRRPGLPRLPRGHRHQPGEPARLPRRGPARRPLQRPPLVGAGHADRPQHLDPGAPAERGERTRGRHRRAGPGSRRLAGARRRVRRPRLGAAPVRHEHRHRRCRSAPPPGRGRRCVDRPMPSRSTSPASARRRWLSASSRARRAS